TRSALRVEAGRGLTEGGAGSERRAVETSKVASMRSPGAAVCSATATWYLGWMKTWDALVVGSGQSGVPLAVELGRAGRRTAIVERADVGGTCVNVGCTPTKTLVASARVAALIARAGEYGIEVGAHRTRWPEVREREQGVVRQFRASGERRLANSGVTLLRGEARFVGPRRMRVSAADGTTEEHEATWVVLNTGVRGRQPDLPGLDSVRALASSAILTLPD